MKPLFYYMDQKAYDDALAGNGYDCQIVNRYRYSDRPMLRVAVVPVAPTITDSAWDLMTERERAALAPWPGSTVPNVEQMMQVAADLAEQAAALSGAAEKLRMAAAVSL